MFICRENKIILFEKAKLDITSGMNESIESWCTGHGYSGNVFNEKKLNFIQKSTF